MLPPEQTDINDDTGKRVGDWIVFSNNGLIHMTTDHDKTFTEIPEDEI
jgi:hypothetical protein